LLLCCHWWWWVEQCSACMDNVAYDGFLMSCPCHVM
jgi:hypothetical protein